MRKSFFLIAVGMLLGGCATAETASTANPRIFQQHETHIFEGKKIIERLDGHVAESLVEFKCPDLSAVKESELRVYFRSILNGASNSEEWLRKMSLRVRNLSNEEIDIRKDQNVLENGAVGFEVFNAGRVRKFVIFKGVNEFACDISSRELAEMNAVIYGIKGSPLKTTTEKKVIMNFN